MSCAFLKDLARQADEAMKANNGLYISIRICPLGVKILIEKGPHSHSYILGWHEIEYPKGSAFQYINVTMVGLDHYMAKWEQARA